MEQEQSTGREPRSELNKWEKRSIYFHNSNWEKINTCLLSHPHLSTGCFYKVSLHHAISAPSTESRYWPEWAALSLLSQEALKTFPFSQSSANHLWATLLGIQEKLSTYLTCLVQAKTRCELSWTKNSWSPEPAENGESSNCILETAEIQGHWREQMEFQRFFTCKWIFPLRVPRLNNTPYV